MATYTYTGKIVTFTAPATGVYDLVAYGRKVEAQAAAWERRSAEISRSRRARRCRSPWAASGRPTLSPPTPAPAEAAASWSVRANAPLVIAGGGGGGDGSPGDGGQTGPAGAVGTGQGGSGGSGGYGGQPSGEAGAGGGFKGAGISGNGYSGGQGFPILTGGTGSFGPRRPGLLVEARLQRGDALILCGDPLVRQCQSGRQRRNQRVHRDRKQGRKPVHRRIGDQPYNQEMPQRPADHAEISAKLRPRQVVTPGDAAPRHRHRRRPSAVALVWKPRYGERHAEQRQKPALLLPEAPNRRR